jgi:flotillin
MESLQVEQLISVAIWAAVAAGSLLLLYLIIRNFLYICRPNEVLIFSGRTYRNADGTSVGTRIEFSGRHWRVPILEKVDCMDLTTIPIEIITTGAYSKDGIPLNVRAIANVKISSDRRIIRNAVERFLGRNREELRQVAKETLEGTLRGVLATLTPEEVNEDRLKFAESLTLDVKDDFEKLGLQLDTLKVQHVTDDKEYLESIGRQRIARVIRAAEIAESNATNEANQRAAEAKARGDIARQEAERAIVGKRNEQRKIAADLKKEVESAQREAKARGEQARYEAEQELQAIRRQLEQIRLKAEVEVPAEAQKRGRELLAKGEAAPIEEDGRALAQVLELLARAWAAAGPHARDVFLIQQIEKLMATVVRRLAALKVAEVNIIDPGDGSALPNYVAGFPQTVTAVLSALRETTGIDVPQILSPNNNGHAPARPAPQLAQQSR